MTTHQAASPPLRALCLWFLPNRPTDEPSNSRPALTTVLTTRRLLALCARLERGAEFSRALQVCVLNKVPPEDRKVIGETFDHHLGPLAQDKA
jgi:hypothetical protein